MQNAKWEPPDGAEPFCAFGKLPPFIAPADGAVESIALYARTLGFFPGEGVGLAAASSVADASKQE